ncbi:hypothetical protein FOG18_13110 [Legionella israelensis]|uniref:hypothetical protein n=1 Tax=Legionella israelensis TaxID=454 RepID=UPI00117D39EA|nr:hypothetical protein [Legionella israelensis]QDP73435.1 hypothetical protein FOG18_13110 [Legionella israelensis]
MIFIFEAMTNEKIAQVVASESKLANQLTKKLWGGIHITLDFPKKERLFPNGKDDEGNDRYNYDIPCPLVKLAQKYPEIADKLLQNNNIALDKKDREEIEKISSAQAGAKKNP